MLVTLNCSFPWLGQRDSNPRNRHQKPGSCRWTMPQSIAGAPKARSAHSVYLIAQRIANAIEQLHGKCLCIA